MLAVFDCVYTISGKYTLSMSWLKLAWYSMLGFWSSGISLSLRLMSSNRTGLNLYQSLERLMVLVDPRFYGLLRPFAKHVHDQIGEEKVTKMICCKVYLCVVVYHGTG